MVKERVELELWWVRAAQSRARNTHHTSLEDESMKVLRAHDRSREEGRP
jgi:hypothetical protein